MVADDRRLLAIDESNPTRNIRSTRLGISEAEEARRVRLSGADCGHPRPW